MSLLLHCKRDCNSLLHVPTKRWELNPYVQSPMPVRLLHNYILFFYSSIADKPYTDLLTYQAELHPFQWSHNCCRAMSACKARERIREGEKVIIHSKSNTTKYRKKRFNFQCTNQKESSPIFLCIQSTGHLLKEAPQQFTS